MADDGPGFASEILDGSAPALTTTKAEGTGLGLILCRSIIERQGGPLILSNESNGATVIMSLPLPAA